MARHKREKAEATPAAEAAAEKAGVKLDEIEGSGEEGRVLKSDVEAAAEAADDAEPEAEAANPERDAFYRRMGLDV